MRKEAEENGEASVHNNLKDSKLSVCMHHKWHCKQKLI